MIVVGVVGFGLFFLSDLNDCKFHIAALKTLFPIGAILLLVSTIFLSVGSGSETAGAGWRIAAGITGFLFLLLEIFTLFFAIPAGEAYGKTGKERTVIQSGMYALCRHPGVLWFIPLYLCLWLCFGVPLTAVCTFSALDLLLIIFEDTYAFPRIFTDYSEYRRNVPFLIPTAKSLSQCVRYYF